MKELSEKILSYNQRGLIQGPDESIEAYSLRCQKALKREPHLDSQLAFKLFDIRPDWVEVDYSNASLYPWEGGCTWIKNHQYLLQLRKVFQKKSFYLGYSREEIFAHELVHIIRGGFKEPIFEEILAYQTSRSRFRRFFGPFFRSSRESLFFVTSLWLTGLIALLTPYEYIIYINIFSLLSYGMIRLFKAQFFFSKACKNIGEIVGKEKALAVMVRLKDEEIIQFAKLKKQAILSYAMKMQFNQTRWQQIYSVYFPSHVTISKKSDGDFSIK
ncbi:MAG: hypothetical protein R3E91_03355 [Chlamydiales bacterium]